MSTQENLFQSIDYIIEARMSEIAKDVTELCTIVKVYEEKDNKPNTYYVSNGQLKFDAIAQGDAKYVKDTQVYVLIPSGDYSGTKLILGSYKSENPYKYKYIAPEDEIVKAWETTKKENINQPDVASPDADISLYQKLSIPYSGFGKYDNILFTLGLSTTQLWDYNNKQTYYINFILTSKTANKTYLLRIPSTELYGNPYYLDSRYPISYILPLPLRAIDNDTEAIVTLDISDITALSLAPFTQMIKDENGKEVWSVNDKIQLNTLQLALGYKGENFASQSTQIKLTLDLDSNAEPKDTDYIYNGNTKNVSFDLGVVTNNLLAIYNESNIAPTDYEGYYAYWCRYVNGYQKTDDSGNWKENQIDATGVYWEAIEKKVLNNGYNYTFTPNVQWNEDRLKVVLYKDDKSPIYESNILVFKNQNEAAVQGANKATDEIKLVLAPGDNGNYNIYGTDNRLVSYTKKNQKTSVSIEGFYDGVKWNDKWIVTWRIPKMGTMLQPSNPADWVEEANYYSKSGQNLKEIIYDFADIYSSTRVNNTIYCEVNTGVGGKVYRGSISLAFGRTNTNGSGYSLNIIPSHYGGLEDGKSIIYTATIEADDGTIIEQQPPIKWTWYYGNTNSEGQPYLRGFPLSDNEDIATLAPNQCQVARNDSVWQWDFNVVSRLILKAEVFNWQTNTHKVNLTAAYPIALGKEACYITGASRIMYDYAGHLSSYDTAPYNIFGLPSAAEVEDPTKVNTSEDEYIAIVWAPSGEQNIPQVETATNALKPLPQKPALTKPCHIQIKNKTKGFNAWYQPLLIEQDTYASALLNEWDGNLIVDSKGNKILAQSIGAGIKNSDNEYTGVLMGKVELDSSTSPTGLPTTNYGLYGFNKGELKFSFDEEGNGYLAGEIKANKGNIGDWKIQEGVLTQPDPEQGQENHYTLRFATPTSKVGTEEFIVLDCKANGQTQFELTTFGFLTIRDLALVSGTHNFPTMLSPGDLTLYHPNNDNYFIMLHFNRDDIAVLEWNDPISNGIRTLQLNSLGG